MTTADRTPSGGSAHHPLRGALLLLAGLLLFACLDTTTKYLAARYEVPLIIAVRYVVNSLLLFVLFAPRRGRELVTTRRTGLVMLRALCLAIVSLLVGLALQRMPVAETTAINFLAPMLVVVLAGPVLGERVGRWGWVAALIGFAGVLLIVRPGGGLEPVGVALALAAVVAGTGYQLLSRVLANSERTVALLFYTALVGSIGFGLAAPWFLGGAAPGWWQVLLFLSLGVYGGLGHFLFTAAYALAPASMLSPMTYLQLVWAGLLGWLVFGHVPDAVSMLGMGVVAASGLLAAVASPRAATVSAEEAGGAVAAPASAR